jgi:lipopolysaccharide export system ATP-binding protein
MEQLLEEFGITHIAGAKGYSLSGGERRRVEIARALITKPAFILLDEPFAGIDPIAVADIQNLIVSLKERNIGVLISDHNVRETLGVCDRAYILCNGEVLEYGTPDEIASSSKARAVYLGDDFRL